jgi:hypothetical protein
LKNPKILFTTFGEGLGGKTLLLVSVHKDFTDYSAFSRELKGLFGLKASSAESFLFSLKKDIVKHFSFKNLKDYDGKYLRIICMLTKSKTIPKILRRFLPEILLEA